MIGTGKYDQECEAIARLYMADMVLVIVSGGFKGVGFSASFRAEKVATGEVDKIPAVLRQVADMIEAEMKEKKKS